MKNAVKFGFGAALGAGLFRLCCDLADKLFNRYMTRRFESDPEFRVRVRTMSPEMYAKYRKEAKEQ